VNRKQRRAASRWSSPNEASGPGIQSIFSDAIHHHQAGRLIEAERRYQQVLAVEPHHADSLHLLGVAAFQGGRFDVAIDLIGKALAVRPDYPEALSNLGNALVRSSRLDDGVACYRKAIGLRPNYPEAHLNLGHVLLQQGKLDQAANSYRKAHQLKPNDIEVLLNLGNILGDRGKPDEAIACYRKALALRPDFAEAHTSLGVTLYSLGRLDEAVASHQRALVIKPGFIMALNNLASALVALGKPTAALSVAQRSLQIEETINAKGILVSCLSRTHGVADVEGLRPLMVRALSEAWGWPSDLARVCIDLVRRDHEIAGCMARAVEAWPRPLSGKALYAADGLAALGADPLLAALLDAAPVCDLEMERFLTMARRALLDAADEMSDADDGLGFYSALARQCFINEYVFAVTAYEACKAGGLRDRLSGALEADAPVAALHLVTVAAYFPLCSLPHSTRLLERSWPEEVAALVMQQVREPAEEQRIGAAVPRLTDIDDDVSLLVRRQYEEMPYPRWIKAPPAIKADRLEAYLSQAFPLASFDRSSAGGRMEILVAGCGTGQQPIRTSQQYPEARILAIDLSRSSLAYAIRKTRELGISSIEYAQADLLKLGSIDRQFDMIEASGVLHHLADPWMGWRILLSLLRPGGFMRLGLYSEIARRDVVRLQKSVAERGYGTTADEIRRCRQDLMMTLGNGAGSADGRASDLFTISGFRDLLLHIQEHRCSLIGIASFLRENDLAFLGFDIAPDVLHRYRSRFSQDRVATDLSQWQVFESENPQTFVGMYQFWVQKGIASHQSQGAAALDP
jgi:tetratricopeptide (TPR) repeat protein/SAM-dependent methyltransferase